MRVQCTEYRVEDTAGSLLTHHQSQHGVERGDQGGGTPTPPSSRGGQELPGIFPENAVVNPLPGIGVPG